MHAEIDFIKYYKAIFSEANQYGQWLDGLKHHTQPILRFAPNNELRLRDLWKNAGLSWQVLEWYPYALHWPASVASGTPLPGYDEHLFYVMNASSLLPVLALNPQPSEVILDACAAPGGKTVFIADSMNGHGEIIANDTSPQRRIRLQRTLQDYKHPEVTVTSYKAETMFKKFPEYFDKILVDAPCSSEKHVYNSEKYFRQWNINRIKQLKQRQIALLSGLWLALKPGGRLVYSTCATTPEENEAVVATLLKKKKDTISLIPSFTPHAPCEPGWSGNYVKDFDVTDVCRVTASPNHNYDPMFVAVFHKNS